MSSGAGWKGQVQGEMVNAPLPQMGGPDHLRRTPIAEVVIRLYSTEPDQSEFRIWTSPTGELAEANGTGAARAVAYDQLGECLQREIARAVALLRNADEWMQAAS